jgi:hypothetical protein
MIKDDKWWGALGSQMTGQAQMSTQDIKEAGIGFGKPKTNRMRHTPPDKAKPPKFKREAKDQSEGAHQDGVFTRQARHQDGLGE